MRSILALALTALLAVLSCKDSGTTHSPVGSFAIYRLLDTTITTVTALGIPVDSLVLAYEPTISATDLRAYYWASHTFVPRPALQSALEQMAHLPGKQLGVPFVVTVGEQRIYLGSFYWAYSSYLPTVPRIELLTTGSYVIAAPPLSSDPDRRGDPRIRESLKEAGILIE